MSLGIIKNTNLTSLGITQVGSGLSVNYQNIFTNINVSAFLCGIKNGAMNFFEFLTSDLSLLNNAAIDAGISPLTSCIGIQYRETSKIIALFNAPNPYIVVIDPTSLAVLESYVVPTFLNFTGRQNAYPNRFGFFETSDAIGSALVNDPSGGPINLTNFTLRVIFNPGIESDGYFDIDSLAYLVVDRNPQTVNNPRVLELFDLSTNILADTLNIFGDKTPGTIFINDVVAIYISSVVALLADDGINGNIRYFSYDNVLMKLGAQTASFIYPNLINMIGTLSAFSNYLYVIGLDTTTGQNKVLFINSTDGSIIDAGLLPIGYTVQEVIGDFNSESMIVLANDGTNDVLLKISFISNVIGFIGCGGSGGGNAKDYTGKSGVRHINDMGGIVVLMKLFEEVQKMEARGE